MTSERWNDLERWLTKVDTVLSNWEQFRESMEDQ